jgi:uncharacterized membrane protein
MMPELISAFSVARILAAFMFICCFPGFGLSYVMFPENLEPLERAFIACSSSIALSSLFAALLIITQGMIDMFSFFVGLITLTAIFVVIAAYRFILVKDTEDRFAEPFSLTKYKLTNPYLLITILIFLSPVILLVTSSSIIPEFIENPLTSNSTNITEFYISPQKVESILENIHDHQGMVEIPLEIVNHNQKSLEYRLEIKTDNQLRYKQEGIVVPAGEIWQGNAGISLPESSDSLILDIHLYSESSQDLVAQLRLSY